MNQTTAAEMTHQHHLLQPLTQRGGTGWTERRPDGGGMHDLCCPQKKRASETELLALMKKYRGIEVTR